MQEADTKQATRRQVIAGGLGLTGTVLGGGRLSSYTGDDTPPAQQVHNRSGTRQSDRDSRTVRSDDASMFYAEDGALTVAQPPRDMDGDSLFEDVDGDGSFCSDDIRAFCASYDGDVITMFTNGFDYDGDGSVTRADRRPLQRYLHSESDRLRTVDGPTVDVNVFAHPDVTDKVPPVMDRLETVVNDYARTYPEDAGTHGDVTFEGELSVPEAAPYYMHQNFQIILEQNEHERGDDATIYLHPSINDESYADALVNGRESIIAGAEHLPDERGTPLLTSYSGSRPAHVIYHSLSDVEPVNVTFPVSTEDADDGDGEQVRITIPLGDTPVDQQDAVYSTTVPDQV